MGDFGGAVSILLIKVSFLNFGVIQRHAGNMYHSLNPFNQGKFSKQSHYGGENSGGMVGFNDYAVSILLIKVFSVSSYQSTVNTAFGWRAVNSFRPNNHSMLVLLGLKEYILF